MSDQSLDMSRRSFLKGAGTLGALAAAGSAFSAENSFFTLSPTEAIADSNERIVWSHCNVNCHCTCPLQFHVKDDMIVYTEPDNTGSCDIDAPQPRACLKGRSIRRFLESPNRLNYPMKRVGKRGEGKFEQISWDEALDTIASEMKRIRDTYGNEAIHLKHSTGLTSGLFGSNVLTRLLNLTGGYLNYYGTPSFAQLTCAAEYTYGDTSQTGSSFATLQPGQLVVAFGASPAEAKMGGGSHSWAFMQICERLDVHVINIDYRRNDSMCNWPNWEYVPIRPGTDAALVSAIAYELIQNNWVDEEYLATYCVGYDEETLPDSAKGQNKSYKDYILGNGYDMIPKTPEWASPITQIPVDKIREIARRIGTTKPVFITQGFGPLRHSNGELTCRSILALPNLIGQIGLPGTNDGRSLSGGGLTTAANISNPRQIIGFQAGSNPVKTQISYFTFYEAIEHPENMTSTKMGVRGSDKLNSGIKMLFMLASNGLNQHCDINHTHDILVDESLCEFIVVIDVMMTNNAKYADILLPDLTKQEQITMATNNGNDPLKMIIFGEEPYAPRFERRNMYDICKDLARRLDVYDEYTEGHETCEEWLRDMYEKTLKSHPELPSWDEGFDAGIWKDRADEVISLAAFRKDPQANKLKTPSGKIELYSETLAEFEDTWELAEGQVIKPIPYFDPGIESYQECNEQYPLIITGFHHKGTVHSTFWNSEILRGSVSHNLWINPVDAEARGIEEDDLVRVYTERGEIRIRAKVTDRVIPGVVTMPQGAWHDADMEGDRIDHGGCINTLTRQLPTPIYKAAPMHTNIGQVEKVEV